MAWLLNDLCTACEQLKTRRYERFDCANKRRVEEIVTGLMDRRVIRTTVGER